MGDDRHEAGKTAAREALRRIGCRGELAFDGARPIVVGRDDNIRISIAYGKRRALAVAARAIRLGIDLGEEPSLVAREAARKALGRGLLAGDVVDDSVVRVTSLDPPRLACSVAALELIGRIMPEGALAIVYSQVGR